MLRLQVLEGRYGQVRAEGDPKLAAAAQDYLRPLRGGEVIESAPLERAALLLSDLPGVTATPSIRPGPDLGAGDLPVQVQRGDRVNGSVGLDNQDNRYTGQYRANASLAVNSPFLAGDQITVRAQGTSEDLYFGDVGYSLSLGSAGLPGQVGYGDTGYQPGKDFSDLDARGTAQVASAGLRYPLVRSQSRNLTLGVDFQHKKLRDDYRAADVRQNKSSNRVPFSAQFDLRDGLGGGVTYGALNWTVGHLNLGGALAEADSLTARSAGHFSTVNLDIARLQSLAPRWSLYGRFGGQWTRDNLDSSEDFGPGGPAGVRPIRWAKAMATAAGSRRSSCATRPGRSRLSCSTTPAVCNTPPGPGSRARTSAASPAPAWARAWPWGAGAPRPPRPGAPTAASRSPTAATASRLSG